MSDRLISLNAAIDAVNSIDNLDAKARGGICIKLMGLPSAQPSFSQYHENDHSHEDAVRAAYKHGKSKGIKKGLGMSKAEQQWIPCSKTVDIPDHEILACDKYGEEMFGYLAYEDEQWLCGSDGCVMYDPIAWREKPEPYREEGDE